MNFSLEKLKTNSGMIVFQFTQAVTTPIASPYPAVQKTVQPVNGHVSMMSTRSGNEVDFWPIETVIDISSMNLISFFVTNMRNLSTTKKTLHLFFSKKDSFSEVDLPAEESAHSDETDAIRVRKEGPRRRVGNSARENCKFSFIIFESLAS